MSHLLIGEYEHTLDEKKRVSLPKTFRAALVKRVVMTRGLDNCLYIYSHGAWAKVAEKLQSLSIVNEDTRGFNRFMLSGAAEVEVDGVGRILIPDHQKEFAQLKKVSKRLGATRKLYKQVDVAVRASLPTKDGPE